MSSRIIVNGSLSTAQALLEFVDATLDAREKGRRLKALLDAASSGSDWTAVAAELGLPDPAVVSSTAAQDAWTIISTAVAQIDSAPVSELSRLDQG